MSFPTQVQVSHTDGYKDKFIRRFKQEPLVPIGAVATCAALVMAMTKMRSNERRSFNNWLRVRIIAQGLTVAAIVAGSYAYGRTEKQVEDKARWDQERMLEKTAKERAEFEERLREAEEKQRVEDSILSQSGHGGLTKWSFGERVAGLPTTTGDANKVSKVSRVEEISRENEKRKGWLEWLGWK